MARPAGQVDDTEHSAGYRVADRRAGTGELPEGADVVLAAPDEGRLTRLQSGADAVRARELLGIAVAPRQPHIVEHALDRRIRGDPLKYQAVGRGQDDTHRLRREIAGDSVQHRCRRMGERGVGVRVAHVGQLDAVGVYVQGLRAAPGVEHPGRDGIGVQRARGEELLSCAPHTHGVSASLTMVAVPRS